MLTCLPQVEELMGHLGALPLEVHRCGLEHLGSQWQQTWRGLQRVNK